MGTITVSYPNSMSLVKTLGFDSARGTLSCQFSLCFIIHKAASRTDHFKEFIRSSLIVTMIIKSVHVTHVPHWLTPEYCAQTC